MAARRKNPFYGFLLQRLAPSSPSHQPPAAISLVCMLQVPAETVAERRRSGACAGYSKTGACSNYCGVTRVRQLGFGKKSSVAPAAA